MGAKTLKDGMSIFDSTGNKHPQTLWKKTEIIGGYDRFVDKNGISQIGEVVFESENMVPLGGVQYAMEKIFGITGSISAGYLNDLINIGCQGLPTMTPIIGPYPQGHNVCVFGIGTGGAAANNQTALPVKYNERTIVDMVPFRYTAAALSTGDQAKYFGIKQVSSIPAYYLKTFDSVPTVKHLWNDAVSEYEDGTTVDSTVWTSNRTDAIHTFTEILLTISKTDVKEWFTANGGIENTRVNSIALMAAVKNATKKDYEQILLFSKLNIPTEMLSLTKDLNIVYRVYGS